MYFHIQCKESRSRRENLAVVRTQLFTPLCSALVIPPFLLCRVAFERWVFNLTIETEAMEKLQWFGSASGMIMGHTKAILERLHSDEQFLKSRVEPAKICASYFSRIFCSQAL